MCSGGPGALGRRVSSIQNSPPSRFSIRWSKPSDVRHIFAGAADVQTLELDSAEQVLQALESSWAEDRALQLILILLNGKTKRDIRLQAAQQLDQLFGKGAREFVANRLYSAVLPKEADLVGAVTSGESTGAMAVVEFLNEIQRHQSRIDLLQRSFDALPTELFGGAQDRQEYFIRAVNSGLCRELVLAPPNGIKTLLDRHSLPESPLRHLDPEGHLLTEWTSTFRTALIRVPFEPLSDHDT